MSGRFIDAAFRAIGQIRAEGVALPRPPEMLTLTAEQYDCAAMELSFLTRLTSRDDFGNDATEWPPRPMTIEMLGVRFQRGEPDARAPTEGREARRLDPRGAAGAVCGDLRRAGMGGGAPMTAPIGFQPSPNDGKTFAEVIDSAEYKATTYPACHDGQHPEPPPDAFRWSNWATCACGAVRFERLTRRGEIITYSHLDGLRATDGTPIDTRARRDEYMRLNGLAHADDYREAMPAARKARERFFAGEDPAIRREVAETVGRTAYQLQTQKGRRR